MANPNTLVSGYSTLLCKDLAVDAARFPKNSVYCHSLSMDAIWRCGCAYVKPPDNFLGKARQCSFCADGSTPPNPDLVLWKVNGERDESYLEFTCGKGDWQARIVNAGEYVACAALQATEGAACGCPNPPKPSCDPECP
mmetsp:Transcript_10307/g.30392  ORF Transcript_10307/g.30392 Transcript_10307/m.30392 type:complete len:139 (-) Transcript_10307:405-821(-)